MFLDPRSNTCPFAELLDKFCETGLCCKYFINSNWNGLINACVHEDCKKDGSCPLGYRKKDKDDRN